MSYFSVSLPSWCWRWQEDVSNLMSDEFTSDIISEFKENKGTITRGDTTFKLAEYYGFCWGVERAVAMAFQARKHFPDQVRWCAFFAKIHGMIGLARKQRKNSCPW